MIVQCASACVLALLLSGCARSLNYADPRGPRYSGVAAPHGDPGPLRVVTFNIEHARAIDRAGAMLEGNEALAGADLVLLQEMDRDGVQAIAARLRMSYVYYPAVVHAKHGRDFGNAVLSSWPIVSDEKLILPHRAFLDGSQRTATVATVLVAGRRVRAYSVHLATPLELDPRSRRDQLRAILAHAGREQPVIVGGDFNDAGLASILSRHGYLWPTRRVGRTSRWASVDHILARGLGTARDAAGRGPLQHDASDHAPVWAELQSAGR